MQELVKDFEHVDYLWNKDIAADLGDDEFGLPRESAMSIASRKVSESIINKIVSTW